MSRYSHAYNKLMKIVSKHVDHKCALKVYDEIHEVIQEIGRIDHEGVMKEIGSRKKS